MAFPSKLKLCCIVYVLTWMYFQNVRLRKENMLEQMSLAYIWLDYMNYIITFWKIFLATSITGVFGAWSNQNCSVSEIQKYDGYITCECNHLTNFALLMDVSQSRNEPLALSIVTWIGCGISMLGLVFTIITFLYFKLVI